MIPPEILAAAIGQPAELLSCEAEQIHTGTGAVTASVARVSGHARSKKGHHTFTLIRKEFQPVAEGRHADAASDPHHWAYWRREPLAYTSGLLPTGPGLTAPKCYGVIDDVVFLQHVTGHAEYPRVAAARLATWQAHSIIPDQPWLAGHQLEQRLAVSNLDWTTVDADPRLAKLWSRRHELVSALKPLPTVLSHGDFHTDNLIAGGDATIVLDWGTLGTAPIGADLAHLALSTCDDLTDAYLEGWEGAIDPADMYLGYRATLALTGTSPHPLDAHQKHATTRPIRGIHTGTN